MPRRPLEFVEYLLRARHHERGNSGKTRDLHSVRPVGRAFNHFVQKSDSVFRLLHRHAQVHELRERQVCEFVIVSGEERFCPPFDVEVEKLQHRPRYAHPVVGRRAPAYLVEYHETAGRDVTKDVRGLHHLHHERAAPQGEFVARPDPGENPVDKPYTRFLSGDERAHVSHEGYERGRPEIRRFPGHIRAGDHRDTAGITLVGIERYVVRGKGRDRPGALYHRMTRPTDFENSALVHHGPHIRIIPRDLGKRTQDVENGYRRRCCLAGSATLENPGYQLFVNRILSDTDVLLRPEYTALYFLEALVYKSFPASHCLASHIIERRLVGEILAQFDVISENGIFANSHLEPRAFALGSLEHLQIFLGVRYRVAVVVEFGVEAVAYDGGGHVPRQVVDQSFFEQSPQFRLIGDAAEYGHQPREFNALQDGANFGQGRHRVPHDAQVFRIPDLHRDAGYGPFHVAASRKSRDEFSPDGVVVDQKLHAIVPEGYLAEPPRGVRYPIPQKAPPHRRLATVQNGVEGGPG